MWNQVNFSHIIREPAFCICKNKGADQLCDNPAADQHLCFCYIDSEIPLLLILDLKFQASSHLLWLYSPVCVEPDRKFRRWVCFEDGFALTQLMWNQVNLSVRVCLMALLKDENKSSFIPSLTWDYLGFIPFLFFLRNKKFFFVGNRMEFFQRNKFNYIFIQVPGKISQGQNSQTCCLILNRIMRIKD